MELIERQHKERRLKMKNNNNKTQEHDFKGVQKPRYIYENNPESWCSKAKVRWTLMKSLRLTVTRMISGTITKQLQKIVSIIDGFGGISNRKRTSRDRKKRKRWRFYETIVYVTFGYSLNCYKHILVLFLFFKWTHHINI